MTDDDLPRDVTDKDLTEKTVEFYDQQDDCLYHGGMVIDVGRKFKRLADDDGPTYTVMAVDKDSMLVRLTYDFGGKAIHWPSEGGQFVPVDDTGFDGRR